MHLIEAENDQARIIMRPDPTSTHTMRHGLASRCHSACPRAAASIGWTPLGGGTGQLCHALQVSATLMTPSAAAVDNARDRFVTAGRQ
jgi:hypothetical protein